MFVPAWKFFLLRMALAFLVIAWLDPKMGSRLQEVESEGVDMMVALDVSNSMMTEDVGMVRLDLAKRTIKRPRGLHLWRPTRSCGLCRRSLRAVPPSPQMWTPSTCSWNRSTQAWFLRRERLDAP